MKFFTSPHYFRAFQGWMSLSHSRPGTGTLRVLPLLKESTAYWILRPFLSDVPKDLFPGIEIYFDVTRDLECVTIIHK